MPAKPNEIQIIRIYDAPVQLVWEAWTDLNHVEKWWGPRGFTLTTKSKDLRPGGKWIYTMHGPDGTDYPNITTYHEVVKYEKLVYDHGGNEERDKLFTVTVTFKEEQGRTVMNMISSLPTPEEARAMKEFIKKANGYSTWDRLAEYLENETTGKDVFIISRSFEADIDTVFDMWANPEHLSKWLAPQGSTMSYLKVEAREGGTSHYSMTNADGQIMYGKVNYQKIKPHHILVYTQSFCDKDGNLSKPPFLSTWPDTLKTTVTFAEEGKNETRITLQWEIYGDATEAERRAFHEMKSSMNGGWTGSLDKLESLLRSKK